MKYDVAATRAEGQAVLDRIHFPKIPRAVEEAARQHLEWNDVECCQGSNGFSVLSLQSSAANKTGVMDFFRVAVGVSGVCFGLCAIW